jgi:hypothetical protein
MITELVRERLDGAPRAALGDLGVLPDRCPAGCCAARPAAQAGQPAAQAGQPAAQAGQPAAQAGQPGAQR